MTAQLEAMENIRQRKAKYCRYLDTKQFDAWEALFTPDAKIVFYKPDKSVIASFDSIADMSRMTRNLFATNRTVHQTHNSEIDFTSETEAAAIWSMEDWHVFAPQDGNPGSTMHGYGFYHETWKLIDGQWRIARLELHRVLVDHT